MPSIVFVDVFFSGFYIGIKVIGCCHRLINIKVIINANKGKYLQYFIDYYKDNDWTFKGKGNWLIYLAPYFFPTLTVPIVIYLLVVHGATPEWVDALLGATMAYHITSTWRETHREQTDLKKVGFIFAFLFLPAANLAFLGAVLAFAHGGLGSSYQFLVTSFQITDGLWSSLISG